MLNEPTHYYNLDEPFSEHHMRVVPWHRDYKDRGLYDIAALHTKWSQEVFEALLGPEAVFVTILRDPAEAFESLYSYANLEGSERFNRTLAEFIDE